MIDLPAAHRQASITAASPSLGDEIGGIRSGSVQPVARAVEHAKCVLRLVACAYQRHGAYAHQRAAVSRYGLVVRGAGVRIRLEPHSTIAGVLIHPRRGRHTRPNRRLSGRPNGRAPNGTNRAVHSGLRLSAVQPSARHQRHTHSARSAVPPAAGLYAGYRAGVDVLFRVHDYGAGAGLVRLAHDEHDAQQLVQPPQSEGYGLLQLYRAAWRACTDTRNRMGGRP